MEMHIVTDELSDLERRLQKVLSVARDLSVITDRNELLRKITQTSCEVLGFGSTSVAILDGDGRFRIKAMTSIRGDLSMADFQEYSMSLEELKELLGVAHQIGDIYWLEGSEPLLDTLEARGSVVATVPSVPGGQWHPRSLLIAPLYRPPAEIFGVVFPDDPLDGKVPSLERSILIATLAHFASLAIQLHENRSYADAQLRILTAQRERLSELFRASNDVQRAGQLEEILQTTADAVTSAGGFGRSAIYLRSDENLELRVTSGIEQDERARLHESGPIELSRFAEIMQPQMRLSRSYLFDHRKYPLPDQLSRQLSIPDRPHEGVGSDRWDPQDSLTIPIIESGQLLGVISVDEPRDGRFPDLEQVQALEFFADQAGIAVAQMMQYDLLRELAETDPLTGLMNRRSFWSLAERLVVGARGGGFEMAAMFIDLDHFKAINDRFGHSVGDLFIKEAALNIQNRLRTQDVVARFGGEEFVVFLTGVDRIQALSLAESLRMVLASVSVPNVESAITASIGVAVASPSVRRFSPRGLIEELLGMADAALYDAKARGRNRVQLGGVLDF
ncbi:sensor domain-containing diguanylate cyclase [Ferrimicrobium sp.]|uniref:GGDEF domain-containing protein n=1 Tax=Ferrimicrobium sp. TaxID=2926050 RepID=UPI0026350270|nr:sensor domain-containing diguanylate cyclase [Ferrimicrobium sp.]